MPGWFDQLHPLISVPAAPAREGVPQPSGFEAMRLFGPTGLSGNRERTGRRRVRGVIREYPFGFYLLLP